MAPAGMRLLPGRTRSFPRGHRSSFDIQAGSEDLVQISYRGYRLEPGRHDIRVTGTAPVSWYQEETIPTQPPQPPPPKVPFARFTPVEGQDVDRTISVELVASDRAALLRALDPLIKRADYASRFDLDVVGFLESASPFLPDLIVDFASRSNLRGVYAYDALADINTPASRAQLRRFFDEADSLEDRVTIVSALKRTSSPDSVDFFASLLPGRTTPADQRIKNAALSALQCLGDEEANRKILTGVQGWDRETALMALAKTGLREAVTDIVNYPLGDDVELFYKSCSALSTLTHHHCDIQRWYLMLFDEKPDAAKLREALRLEQELWRRWWTTNQSRIPIHGPDDEWKGPGEMPMIR
jgi:hypothetical protein